MKNIVVIYWSGTGNTEKMAKAIMEGASGETTVVKLLNVNNATVDDVQNADVVALGCPSMGDEVLEESEMEPFVHSVQKAIAGKIIALFGSYGWGSGEWMESWEDQMKSFGAILISNGLIINEEPDDEGLLACKNMGAKLKE